MSEKASTNSSRLLLSLTVFSTFFLVISSLFLFHSLRNNPLTPSSVFKVIVVDNPSFRVKPLANNGEPIVIPLPSPPTATTDDNGENKNSLGKPPDLNEQNDDSSLVTKMTCGTENGAPRIYMYDLPPEFHFGLLDWKAGPNRTWPDVKDPSQVPRYPGGLNLQHSVEYWLTLDLLSSEIDDVPRPCSAVRVHNSSEADFIFVPFFASLSYNRQPRKLHRRDKNSKNRKLQTRLLQFLFNQPEWKKSGGKDHVVVAHHPNSMLYARKKLGSARFVLADFGRYSPQIANVEKDVIAPYQHVVKAISSNDSAPFEQRPILVYFQGAIYRKGGGSIRQELYYILQDKEDVHFAFGSAQRSGIRQASQGMGSSKFCLNIAGDTPSSNRLFDAIASHCVPVIISDEIKLPFEDVLDYSEFSVFVWAADAVKRGFLLDLLREIKKEEWTKMWEKLKEVAGHFEYQNPSRPGDAVDMIWQALARKRSAVDVSRHRLERVYRTPAFLKHQL